MVDTPICSILARSKYFKTRFVNGLTFSIANIACASVIDVGASMSSATTLDNGRKRLVVSIVTVTIDFMLCPVLPLTPQYCDVLERHVANADAGFDGAIVARKVAWREQKCDAVFVEERFEARAGKGLKV